MNPTTPRIYFTAVLQAVRSAARLAFFAGALGLTAFATIGVPAAAQDAEGKAICDELQTETDTIAMAAAKGLADLNRAVKDARATQGKLDEILAYLGSNSHGLLYVFLAEGSELGAAYDALDDATSRARNVLNSLRALSGALDVTTRISKLFGCGEPQLSGGGGSGGPGTGGGGQTGPGGSDGGDLAYLTDGAWHDGRGNDYELSGGTFSSGGVATLTIKNCSGSKKSKNGTDGVKCTGVWFKGDGKTLGGSYEGVLFMRNEKPYLEGAYTQGEDPRLWEWNLAPGPA